MDDGEEGGFHFLISREGGREGQGPWPSLSLFWVCVCGYFCRFPSDDSQYVHWLTRSIESPVSGIGHARFEEGFNLTDTSQSYCESYSLPRELNACEK